MDTPNTGAKTEKPRQAWIDLPEPRFFIAGGTLAADAASYLRRAADDLLLRTLLEGQYAYVLDSRQKGKSSLVSRTQVKLESAGVKTVKIDLQSIGSNLNADQWYASLVRQFGRQLKLEREAFECWGENYQIGPFGRWLSVIEQVILPNTSDPIVVFIDEVDFVRSLPFSADELFAGIRECFNRRSGDEPFSRLTFCIIGSATPSQLVQNVAITPFNVGIEVKLTDFARSELSPYAQVLNGNRNGEALLDRVYFWTRGHPYLTQAICAQIAEDTKITEASHVDRLVERTYLSTEARQREPNLLDVSRRLLETQVENLAPDEARGQMLNAYGQILGGKKLLVDDSEWRLAALRLCGAVSDEAGTLTVRNEIYRRAFGKDWIRANMPDAELRRQRRAARVATVRTGLVAGVVLVGIGTLALGFWRLSNERQSLIGQLETKAEELKRQIYFEKMGFMQYEVKAGNWSRVADFIRLTKDDHNRNWEWGHVALQVTPDFEEKFPKRSKLEVQPNGQLMIVTPDGLYEITSNGTRLVRKFPPMNEEPNRNPFGRPIPGAFTQAGGQPNPKFLRGSMRVRWVMNPSGDAIFDAETDRILLPPKPIRHIYDVDPINRKYLGHLTTGPGKSDSFEFSDWELRAIDGDRLLRHFKRGNTELSPQFLPDGSILALATNEKPDQKMDLWHWDSSGNLLEVFPTRLSPNGPIGYAIDFSRDRSMYAAYGNVECEIRRSVDNHVIFTLPDHPKTLNSVDFSEDGTHVVTGCKDGTVRLYDLKRNRIEQSFLGRMNSSGLVYFLGDGKRLGSMWDGNLTVWSINPRSAVETFADPPVARAFLTRNGKTLVSMTNDGTILSRNLDTGKVLRRNVDKREGKPSLATSGGPMDSVFLRFPDLSVAKLDAETLTEELRTKVFTRGEMGFNVLKDGQHLLAFGSPTGDEAGNYAIIDAHSLTVARIAYQGPKVPLWSDNGSLVALSKTGSTGISIYSVLDGKLVRELKLDGPILSLVLSPDGGELAVTIGKAFAAIFDDDQDPLARIEFIDTHTGKKTGVISAMTGRMAYSPSKKLLIGSMFMRVGIWDLGTKKRIAVLREERVYSALFNLSPDGERILTYIDKNLATLWDARTGLELMKLSYVPSPSVRPEDRNSTDTCSFSADGRDVVTVCTDGAVRIWHSLPWKDKPGAVSP